MFNIDEIRPKEEFEVWFVREGSSDVFGVYEYDKTNNIWSLSCIQSLEELRDKSNSYNEEFEAFRLTRPEFWVGMEHTIANNESDIDTFEHILAGAMLLQCGEDIIPRIEKCLNWLRNTDFYTAPASTIYHDSCHGGLLTHTLTVINKVIELHSLPSFNRIPIHEVIITAIVHDWCKIDSYETYTRNVKNEETGKWEQVAAYKYKDKTIPLGHGELSLYIAQKFLKLNIEQALAVRWHMGAYRVTDADSHDLYVAGSNYPMVKLLQFADQLAITNY